MLASNNSAKSKILAIKPSYSLTEVDYNWTFVAEDEPLQSTATKKSSFYQKLLPQAVYPSSLPDRTITLADQLTEISKKNCSNLPETIVITEPNQIFDDKSPKLTFTELIFLCGLLSHKLKPTHFQVPSIAKWELSLPKPKL